MLPRVSLFVTCLVDLLFPRIGEAPVEGLEAQGVSVDFPEAQACCGQPAFNSGFDDEARAVGRTLLDAFEASGGVVCPSGSCAAMVRHHLPTLFAALPGHLADRSFAVLVTGAFPHGRHRDDHRPGDPRTPLGHDASRGVSRNQREGG